MFQYVNTFSDPKLKFKIEVPWTLNTSMLTLPDYPGVSWIQAESRALPYESPNLSDKTNKST